MPTATPTSSSLLAQAEVELAAAQHRRDVARAKVTYLIQAANSEGRPALTEGETAEATAARASRDQARADIAAIQNKIAQLRDLEAEEAEYVAASRQTHPAAVPLGEQAAPAAGGNGNGTRALPAYDHVARIGSEERTYHRGSDPWGRQFLVDVARQQLFSDPAAAARLARHMAEERVERTAQMMERAAGDTNTGNWAGLTVPQYLTDMYAPVARALRPFADICNKHPLPDQGMALDISRITTGTTTALQAAELGGVSGTSADDTLLTVPVQTAAGFQNVSRQAIDRGTGIEDILMQDLFASLGTTLDNTLITQASTGLTNVAVSTAFTTGSPTAALLYPKIMGAAAGVEAAMLARGYPTHAVMHSRRWYWLASQMTSSWPFINQAGIPTQAAATADPASAYNKGVRGRLPIGLEVVVDNNIATTLGGGTEDEMYVVPAMECHLWEDPSAPVFIRAEQPNATSLGVLLVVWEYFAYTFGRYASAMQKVSGTGMIAPVF
jgi:HK97 family phage major capsid protein